METETITCTCYPGGFTPDLFEGPQRDCPTHGEVTRPCPHCEVRAVTHRAGAVEATETLCRPCLADLRRPDRTDALCQCRLPDCGQCTELVDKGLRNERLPRWPR